MDERESEKFNSELLTVVELGPENIDEIHELEKNAWVPGLQSTKELIKERLELGHIILGLRNQENLIGKICFSYSYFSPYQLPSEFPQTFKEFFTETKRKF